jgi:hypothetical protein
VRDTSVTFYEAARRNVPEDCIILLTTWYLLGGSEEMHEKFQIPSFKVSLVLHQPVTQKTFILLLTLSVSKSKRFLHAMFLRQSGKPQC